MGRFIIRLTPDGTLTTPKWNRYSISECNRYIRSLIGEECSIYEHVCPNRLYSKLGCKRSTYGNAPGESVSMLMDEEANCHDLPINPVASWLYEVDKHGFAIRGTVLFVGEMEVADGLTFCALEEKTGLALLGNLSQVVSMFKKADKNGAFFPKEDENV